MKFFTTTLVSLLLISLTTNIVQAQFPTWTGSYTVVSTGSSTICDQTVCCCFVGPVNFTMAAMTITLTYNVQGNQCATGSSNGVNSPTPVAITVPIPSGFVIVPTNVGFPTTDAYILTLSSDSSTLTISDTTNQQCSSIAQMTSSSGATTPIVPMGSSTTMMMMMNTTSILSINSTMIQQYNGSEGRYYITSFYLFLGLLISAMVPLL